MGSYMGNYDEVNLSVMALSGGSNIAIQDDTGIPSIYVAVPRGRISDVLTGGSQQTHPAFIVNNSELDRFYFSKYENCIEGDRAYSLPFRDPQCYITFDRAVEVCANKGMGFHLGTNAEWAYLALWSKKNGTVPHGNNYCGCDMDHRHEHGIQSYDWVLDYNWNNMANKIEGNPARYHHTGRVLTGSGPVTWTHDHTNAGVYGMKGNVWKWIAGMRIMNGEVQIIPYNNAAAQVPMTRDSSFWKAILPNGNLVAPGTAGTLKYDAVTAGDALTTEHNVGGGMILNTSLEHPQYTGGSTESYFGYGYMEGFNSFTAKAGVSVPEIMKALMLFPADGSEKNGAFWVRNYGERLPLRGGSWPYASNAGVDALFLSFPRSFSGYDVGLFSAFVDLKSGN